MLIKQGKTNIKYLLIVVILATIIGGGVLYCYLNLSEYEFTPIKYPPKTEKEAEDETTQPEDLETLTKPEKEVLEEIITKISFAIKQKNPSICQEIDSLPFKNSCFIKIAFELKDPETCDNLEKINLNSLKDWAELYYFSRRVDYLNSKDVCRQISQEEEPWKTYQNEKYNWEINYPNDFIIKEDDFIYFTSPQNVITLISPEIDLWGGKYYSDFLWINIEETEQALEDWIKNRWYLEEFKEFTISPEESNWSVDIIEKIVVGENLESYLVHEWAQAYDFTHRYISYKNIVMGFNTRGPIINKNAPLLNQILSSFKFLE